MALAAFTRMCKVSFGLTPYVEMSSDALVRKDACLVEHLDHQLTQAGARHPVKTCNNFDQYSMTSICQ